MHVVLLNQYYPPDGAPTGVMLGAVAQSLLKDGHEVTVFCASGGYSAAKGDGGTPECGTVRNAGSTDDGGGIRIVRIGATRFGRGTFVGKLLDYASFYLGVAWKLLVLRPKPDLVVADEPVSALDVSVQAQVLNLLRELKDELGLTLLFVAHNLAVVEHVSDRVAVMYLGKVVEEADRDSLYDAPQHPYTEALFSAIPQPDPSRSRNRTILQGEVPSPLNPPSGCFFHPRCPIMEKGLCDVEQPAVLPHATIENHSVACHLRGK